LGSWDPKKAYPLKTDAQKYPVWSSMPLEYPAGQDIEFKYIVQMENLSGKPTWEGFNGNRKISPASGQELTARSVWDNANTTCSSVPVSANGTATPAEASTKVERTLSLQEEDQLNLLMAETHVEEASAEVAQVPLANVMSQREPMRRNFSQSLLTLDQDWHEGDKMERQNSEKAEAEVVEQTIVQEAEAPEPAERGVPLRHITSFSALTAMLEPEEKAAARQTLKVKAQKHYEPYNRDVPVVIVTSEIAPWSKTGGLGLVAASYGYEFARNGHRTMCVSPKYKHYEHINYIGECRVRVDNREENVKYWHRYMDHGDGCGTDYVFVEHSCIERQGGLYNGDDGREYSDNLFRFTLLSLAAMEAPLNLTIRGSKYGDKVLFLANDWQAGLVPLLLCHKYRKNRCYEQARCIYVIHNLGYQGQYHNINAQNFFCIDHQAASDVGMGNSVNLCKGALICADRVITVSPNYMKEIQTPHGGFNLQDFVKAKGARLGGILNGIDDVWNPETDHDIHRNYSVDDFEEGKRENKAALQKMLNLKQDPDAVVIGFVGRLTWQKGVDVMGSIISWLMEDAGNGVTGKAQLIMMGNGERQYADTLRWGESTYPGKVCGYVGFDPKVEHQIMAGADLFLMPSRYEPCGLPQMYSQQYGTLPIVTATGGLVDSVVDVAEGVDKATGFQMSHLASDKMKEVVFKACDMFINRGEDFKLMQHTAMLTDFFWPRAMDEYEQQIDKVLYEPPLVR
jgi:starch synthase